MAVIIGATGVTLPPPQALYPATVLNAPQVVATNRISLPPGADVLIPPGRFLISPGQYSQVQVYDPVNGTWYPYTAQTVNEAISIESDGVNFRIMNPTGFPIGAIITSSGAGYTSTPVITASSGGSTWQAIVGGGLSALNITTVSSGGGFSFTSGGSGTNYAASPVINIAAPPYPGIQATVIANLSGTTGSIGAFTIINPGAGYVTPPAAVIVPQATDLNALGGTVQIKPAAVTTQTSYVGMLTGVIMLNEGNNVQSGAPVLSFSGGGGSGAAAVAVMAWTLTGITVTTPGSGYTVPAAITTVGGTYASSVAATNNPILSTNLLVPRNANITTVLSSNTSVAFQQIIDGGLFPFVPTPVVIPGPTTGGVAGSTLNQVMTATVGGANDTVYIQPL
jgi:hypothetical protein